MRQRVQTDFWRSYSDLAMGVMAVFALIMILLLVQEKDTSKKLRIDQDKLKKEKERLTRERREFARQLAELLETAETTRIRQDQVLQWVRGVFASKECQLSLDNNNNLVRQSAETLKKQAAAQLYETGEVILAPKSYEALKSCRREFERMAVCLSPDPMRQKQCLDFEKSALAVKGERRTRELQEVLGQFRGGLEALVLQGNTDSVPYRRKKKTPKLYTAYRRRLRLKRRADSFVKNAFLGAERARQALGQLLDLVSKRGPKGKRRRRKAPKEGLNDPLEIYMRHLRIESPSFGRYQAGPYPRRPECRGKQDNQSCAAARNLRLLIRWKKRALRKPYEDFRDTLCTSLRDESSTFSRGLLDADPTGQRRTQLLRDYCRARRKGQP